MTCYEPQAEPADESTTRPLRVGIAGTGKIAGVISGAIHRAENATLAAVSSRRLENAESFAREHGARRAFGSWREMCESTEVDAVYVATPTMTCEAIAVAAASAGKHVLAEKPFVDLATLQRITGACRDHGVAFLDATHFVHHPRTARIQEAIRSDLGRPLALRSSFFALVKDRSNIRFDPKLEPTGVIGDLAWYCFRATVEFLDPQAPLMRVETRIEKEPKTGAALRATGFFAFGDGTTSTWDAGFDVGAFLQDLDILGRDAAIHLDDFVHDWQGSYEFGKNVDDADLADASFVLKRGNASPETFETVSTPSRTAHQVLMIERLASLAASENLAADNEPWIRASERTQELVDAAWTAAT